MHLSERADRVSRRVRMVLEEEPGRRSSSTCLRFVADRNQDLLDSA